MAECSDKKKKTRNISGGNMAELESAGLVIWRPSVPVPPSRLAGFVLGSQEFKSSAMLVKKPTGLSPSSWDILSMLCFI